MDRNELAKTKRDVEKLFESTLKFKSQYSNQTKEYIYVGEYGLALDDIAEVYLKNNEMMPPDLFQIFKHLATIMELEKDEEYQGAIKLLARAQQERP